jgi:hypothetical protein
LKLLLNCCFSLAVHGEPKRLGTVIVSLAPRAKHGSRIRIRGEIGRYVRLVFIAALSRRARYRLNASFLPQHK